jgi:SAM-dependent methyltransferase
VKILNLGCGTRTSPRCVNIDWSIYLRLKRSRLGDPLARALLRGERLQRYRALEGEIVVHDLRKGIPAQSGSVDAVYHSHVLEHLEREDAGPFLAEVRRVLKEGGVQRVVVPDFEYQCRTYVVSLEQSLAGEREPERHEEWVAAMLSQLVRREAYGTSQQPRLRRLLENRVLGDAQQRGETHRWMYDRVSLPLLLRGTGFSEAHVVDYATSAIPDWEEIGLDRGPDGGEYIPNSLYVEAIA